MKLVRFRDSQRQKVGVVREDELVALDPIVSGDRCDLDMDDLVARWSEFGETIADFFESHSPTHRLADVTLLPPLVRPQKIVGIGANYLRPGRETSPANGNEEKPSPVLFLKAPSAIIGPNDPIILPPEAPSVIGEVELAVVIGRPGHRINPAQAKDHIFGFMIANDVTAPEILLGESASNPLLLQQSRGKGFPTFCPIGPWIETTDSSRMTESMRLEQYVDEFLEIEGQAQDMIFGIEDLVADISCAFGLNSGDIILTGSPPPIAGVRTPLQSGNLLQSKITGLGTLANPVRH